MNHQMQQSMLMLDEIIFQLYPIPVGELQEKLSREKMRQVTQSRVAHRKYLIQTMSSSTNSFRIRIRG